MIHQKICFIGASAVGKTSLIRRYVDGIFSEKYLTTIGVKIDKKQVSCTNNEVQLMIWDIEGTDDFCEFQAKYLRGAAAYILVLDQSRPSSFVDALAIYELASQAANIPGFLVMNKSDLPSQLQPKQLEQLADLPFAQRFTTSAKEGENVEYMFNQVSQILMDRRVVHG